MVRVEYKYLYSYLTLLISDKIIDWIPRGGNNELIGKPAKQDGFHKHWI